MPRTLAVLLATLALLAVGGALFLYKLDSRDGDGVVIAPLEVPREPVLASQPDGERRLVEAPPSGVSVVDAEPAVEIRDSPAQVPQGLAPYEAPYRVPGEVFEAKYGSLTLAELAAHKGMLEIEHNDRLQRINDARFAAGLYEEYVVEPAEDREAGLDLPPWPEHKNLTKTQRTESLPDGRVQVRRTVIPYAEHPDYYAGLDELFWVTRRTNKLHAGALVGGQ